MSNVTRPPVYETTGAPYLGSRDCSVESWEDGIYRSQYVRTAHGLAECQSYKDETRSWTEIELVHDGVSYRREWDKAYGQHAMATLAFRMAADVVEGRFGGKA